MNLRAILKNNHFISIEQATIADNEVVNVH